MNEIIEIPIFNFRKSDLNLIAEKLKRRSLFIVFWHPWYSFNRHEDISLIDNYQGSILEIHKRGNCYAATCLIFKSASFSKDPARYDVGLVPVKLKCGKRTSIPCFYTVD